MTTRKSFAEVQPGSRTQWRAWLEKNHTQKESIWVILAKKGSNIPSLSVNDLVEEALCFGWIDSVPGKVDAQRFKVLLSPRKPKSNWSKLNKQRAQRMIKAKLMKPAGMAMIQLAKKTGTWNALLLVDQLKIPHDLQRALDQQPVAKKYFHAFPPSTRRGILEWIGNARTETTRTKRIVETVTLAARNVRANQYTKKSSKKKANR